MNDPANDPTNRRRRRRASAPQGPPPSTPANETTVETQAALDTAPPQKPAQNRNVDRTLRDLVGGGTSQVGISGALRARDVNRPTEEDLAAAERNLVIVRRHWKPPAS